ncbi:hypothetical protein RHSIM_Rhsim13G0105800 [Rhododendron simsii]|uniref:Uncharacterized protein n=1 Tax=Rhododendron simsii TaxID=118357 RepID=A0A834L8A5_RHOSS|nr:hypothetical protein RHSIM_Rhsim13G0105800 [Rhododendron simsii]
MLKWWEMVRISPKSVKVFSRSWVPLHVKTAITSLLQYLGGIHSGCGISSIAWLMYALGLTLRDRENTSTEIIAVASTTLSLFSGSIPFMRRVKVNVSVPSTHASIIKFEGGTRPGIFGRISPSPFSEWHAFGIISDGKKEHMMLAGAVGDFPESLVSNPPSQLSPCAANVCLLWAAKGIDQNFGKEIKEWVSGYPKDKVIIHDTAVLGSTNISQMSVDAARNWGAEVVIVTSNPEGSRDIVNACKAAGISAFGPIWDS